MIVPEERILEARILVVDDNPTNVMLLRDMLEAQGFTDVHGETNPLRALERLAETRFDLLLLDIRMPGLDGHEVLARLPAVVGGYLPVIVMTAQTDNDTRMRALAAGARDFMTKPFDMSEAMLRIRNTLESQILFRERGDQAQALEREVETRTKELAWLAAHDPITLLANRTRLREVLDQRLQSGEGGLLLFVSVEGVGGINDALGHAMGEAVLRAVGRRLRAALPEDGMAASWGGSDFLLMEPACPAGEEGGCASDMAAKVLRAFEEPLCVEGNDFVLDARIGSCLFPDDGTSSEALIQRAGLAVLHASQRKRPHRAFSSDLEESAARRHVMERELRGAVDRQEFQVFYQPKVSLRDGRPVGMEALLRWTHPDLGTVSPGHFIPLAEETGAVVQIGEWVMTQACADAARFRADGHGDLVVAVNVSGRQFEAVNLPEMVRHALDAAGLPPSALEVEITETALMRDMNRAREVLAALRDLGVAIAIDDFGTGYSSLSYLRHLPINTLKVDQSFVRDIDADADDRAIVRTILAMAETLGLTAVAEGVETTEHLDFLRRFGCPLGQGYLFARPMPAGDFAAYLAAPALA
jgi:diguanylate cyclase (GGDEF)-like protein